jgi:hypothetical protein
MHVAPRDWLFPMLREGPWIIHNGVGAVNSTIEPVEPTQRHGLLAIARFGAAAVGTRGLARQAPTELKEPEASTSEGPKTGKGSAAILRAGRRPAVACTIQCWPLNPRWSSVFERNALRPFLAGCCPPPRSPVRPLSNALRAFNAQWPWAPCESGLNGRHEWIEVRRGRR